MFNHLASGLQRTRLRAPLILALSVFLAGCLSLSSDDESGNPVTGAQPTDIALSGSVGDGPIIGATVTIRDFRGDVIRSVISDAEARYNANVPAGSGFPLTLSASGGIDLVTQALPDFVMTSAVMNNTSRTANVNPFTTLIVKTAQSMSGGLGVQNLQTAKNIVLADLNFGFDSALTPDPITTPVTTANVANIVKSSEALGEMIRRTRDALLVTGLDYSEDEIIHFLAQDLGTGKLDGSGAGANTRVSATAKIVSAQVLVESLRNELRVDGSNATERLDAAIATTMPGALMTTASVALTGAMIEQAEAAIRSAQGLLPSEELDSLASAVQQLLPGTLPAEIDAAIPSIGPAAFNAAIAYVVTANPQELQGVNDGEVPPDNEPPPSEDPAGLTISDTSPDAYQWDTLAIGKQVYADRAFSYTSIPPAYAGYHVLRTRNADKNINGNSFVQFTVSTGVAVYVAIDSRMASAPTWLSGWTVTGDSLITSDTTLRLHRKEFPQGAIMLGGNQGADDHSMYTVLVAALQNGAGGGEEPGGDGDGNGDGNGDGGTNPGNGNTNAVPVAANDTASTSMNTAVNINVLANDSGLADTPITVSVISGPSNGQTQVTQDNRVVYTPGQGFSGTDTFNYRTQDANGDFSTAAVTIEVVCSQCATGVTLVYAWDASAGPVSGYRIYMGGTRNTATQQISNIPANTPGFNAALPSISYNAWNDLQIETGETVCLRVKAYNSAGDSAFSEGVCRTIPQ